MTYLYSALGIIMITSLMTMIEMSISITSNPIDSTFPINHYSNSGYNLKDKEMLILLSYADQNWGEGDTLCSKIVQEINDPSEKYSSLLGYTKTTDTISTHTKLIGSCTLAKNNHRMLITKHEEIQEGYSLYSCFTEKEYCIFEYNS